MTSNYINIATSSAEHYSSSFSLPMGNNQIITYQGIKQLYYNDFDNTTGTIEESGSHEHYLHQSDITNIRYLNTVGTAISIPRKKTGTHIEPNTVRVKKGTTSLYVENQDDYIVTDYFTVASGLDLYDDGKGNLINNLNGDHIGNVIYPHGLILITDPTLTTNIIKDPSVELKWKSNQPIYTYNYHVKVSDYEFNHTLNPTALTGSNNRLKNNVSGSNFQPYITSVGLYNDVNELIAIGKLSQPLQKPADTELTIQVKLDI